MASLALLVTIIILFTLLVGPITYLLAKIGFPSIIIYVLSLISILIGINFCLIATPVWYLGLLPIYCGYISIRLANKK
jgi:hypothetical protein